MKKMLVLSALILLFASTIWAQERCEAPPLKVGDKWKYGYKMGKQWTQEVVAIEDDVYLIRYGNEIRGYDKKTMNLNLLIDERDKRTKFRDTRSKVLNFPLYVGKKWSHIASMPPRGRPGVEQNYKEEHLVSAYENVTVAAGTFKAFKIEYKQMNMSTMREGARGSYWYSPDVKAIVKRVEEVSIDTRDMELISYTLK